MATPPNSTDQTFVDARRGGWSSFTKYVSYATIVIIAILIVLAAVFVHRTTGAKPV